MAIRIRGLVQSAIPCDLDDADMRIARTLLGCIVGVSVTAIAQDRRAFDAPGLPPANDVIRTDNYITDLKQLPLLRKVRAAYLPAENPPASTLLVVSGLFRPDLMVEVSVEAILPEGRKPRCLERQ